MNPSDRNMNPAQEQRYEKNTRVSSTTCFAKGMCFFKLFWFFLIGCVVGTYYEQILHFFKTGGWESRQGVLYGPFNPVYGFGMALILSLLYKVKVWWHILLYGAFIGGGLEYGLSYLQELLIHSRSWDYSNHFLNLHGRTTIPFMIFWGFLALVIVKFIYPPVSNLIESIPYKQGKGITIGLLIFMTLDMVLTGIVLVRQGQRLQEKEPYTLVGEWIDEVYSDEMLDVIFPNMS